MMERIMYNRVFKYLNQNNLLYNRQSGFQKGYSTSHAIIQLENQITDSFNKKKFTLGVFRDLSKDFDTVDYSISIKNYATLALVKVPETRWK